MKLRSKGFTIVELLVVIVIIAILAAITITTFNGIQQRARNSARSSEIANDLKLIALYTANTGLDLDATNGNYYCIGTGFPNGKCRDSYAPNLPVGIPESDMAVTNKLKTYGSVPSSHFTVPTSSSTVGPYIQFWPDGWGYSIVMPMEGEAASDCPPGVPDVWWNDPNSILLLCGKDVSYSSQNST